MIHETKTDAAKTLNEIILELGEQPLTDKQINEWGIQGGETTEQLRGWANDYVGELQSDRAEYSAKVRRGNY